MMYCGSWFQILGPYTENYRSAKETQWVQGSTKCCEQEADDRKSSLFGTYLEHVRDLSGSVFSVCFKH